MIRDAKSGRWTGENCTKFEAVIIGGSAEGLEWGGICILMNVDEGLPYEF